MALQTGTVAGALRPAYSRNKPESERQMKWEGRQGSSNIEDQRSAGYAGWTKAVGRTLDWVDVNPQ